MKSPGQIAYEAFAAQSALTHGSSLGPWDQLIARERTHWEVAARAVVEGTQNQHITRFSDASTFDEVCIKCGVTDSNGPISGPCR